MHPIEKYLNVEEKEIFEERAGICEFDGNLTKREAEVIAAQQIIDRRKGKHDPNN